MFVAAVAARPRRLPLAHAKPNQKEMADPLKALLPYLQRAEEMGKHDARVAYYCRMYALELGLAIPCRTPDADALLAAIMKQLEDSKPTAGLADDDGCAPAARTRVPSRRNAFARESSLLLLLPHSLRSRLYMEGFALRIFGKADALDRGGRRDAGTAKALYASVLFLDVLRQFHPPSGDLPDELAGKQRYAAWRAAQIRGALKDGRPVPEPPSSGGVPGGAIEEGDEGGESGAGGSGGAPPFPAAPRPAPPPGLLPPPLSQQPSPPLPPPPPSLPRSPFVVPSQRVAIGNGSPSPPPGLKPPILSDLQPGPSSSGLPATRIAAAQAAARTAASALSFDDVETARWHIKEALRQLGA